jgi:hypothetical protein
MLSPGNNLVEMQGNVPCTIRGSYVYRLSFLDVFRIALFHEI